MSDIEQNSDISNFAENVLGMKLTQPQIELLQAQADALSDGKELVITRNRAVGQTYLRKVVGEYLKYGLKPTRPEAKPDGEFLGMSLKTDASELFVGVVENSLGKPVDGEMREKLEDISCEYGRPHEDDCDLNQEEGAVNGCTCSVGKLLDEIATFFDAHLQAAVRDAEVNLAKEVYAKFASYTPQEFETFLRMKIGSQQLKQGEPTLKLPKDMDGNIVHIGDTLETATENPCQWVAIEDGGELLLDRYVDGKKEAEPYGFRYDLRVVKCVEQGEA